MIALNNQGITLGFKAGKPTAVLVLPSAATLDAQIRGFHKLAVDKPELTETFDEIQLWSMSDGMISRQGFSLGLKSVVRSVAELQALDLELKIGKHHPQHQKSQAGQPAAPTEVTAPVTPIAEVKPVKAPKVVAPKAPKKPEKLEKAPKAPKVVAPKAEEAPMSEAALAAATGDQPSSDLLS